MDNTKLYYKDCFNDEVQKKYNNAIKKYIKSLENELLNAWGDKDKDKITNISEILEEYREKADEDQKVAIDSLKLSWVSIYRGTAQAWNDEYQLASDDIAYYLSQSTQWVTRELKDKLDYINVIRPHVFFSLNYYFTTPEQQYFCKKKHLYNISSFQDFIKSNLKEVNQRVGLRIDIELDYDEEVRLLRVIREIESEFNDENAISDETVTRIMNKDIELLNIAALKDSYLQEQIRLNSDRMRKKLYLGVREGFISPNRKLYEESLIESYEKNEFSKVKRNVTIYNQQIYRYLDSTPHTKYHLYLDINNKDKKPVVLYSLLNEKDIKDKLNECKFKYTISKSAYREGIEDYILSKAGIVRGKIINLKDDMN